MKILFLSHKFYPDIGGIEVNSEIIAAQLQKKGHEVRLVTWTEERGDKLFSFPVIRHPTLAQLVKQHGWADVVYENNPVLRLSWPALFTKKPTVVALRTWITRTDGVVAWQDKIKLWWLKKASGIIAVSNSVREECWPSATVIGNPYRCEHFKLIEGVRRDINFVFLGRLVSDKGADVAIKALSYLVDKGVLKENGKPLLTIIGDGEERKYLEDLVVSCGMKQYVHFSGTLRDKELVECLNRHKYMLVPSVWKEPFGNVALEGMACGCLPFVSDGGGLSDAVGNGGVIFERGNIDALAKAILAILDNPDLEKKYRENVLEHLRNHQPDRVARKYLEVIEGACRSNISPVQSRRLD